MLTRIALIAFCAASVTAISGCSRQDDESPMTPMVGSVLLPSDDLGHVADVAGLDDGRIAVLDRLDREIKIFDKDGRVLKTISRPGTGPGELTDPIALEVRNGSIVIWDNDRLHAFVVFDTTGVFRTQIRPLVEGDWGAMIFRGGPMLEEHPYRWPIEDFAMRLLPFSDSSFVHLLQWNERQRYFRHDTLSISHPKMVAIEYSLEGRLMDTVATLAGVPSYKTGMVPSGYYRFDQPVFSSRPLFAAGDGWWGSGHGDSARFVIHSDNRISSISLYEKSRRVNKKDKREWFSWNWDIVRTQDSDLGWLDRLGRGKYYRGLAENFRFQPRTPIVTSAFGLGKCLLVAGFAPHDQVSGVSLTWDVIDVQTKRLLTRVRIPRRSAHVRDVDGFGMYTTRRDENGVFLVERWQWPNAVKACNDRG